MQRLQRSEFLRLSAAGALGALSAPAVAAAAPPPAPEGDDIGFVQWAATAELVEQTTRLYLSAVSQAIDPATRLLLGKLLVNDTQHLDALRALGGAPSAFAGLRGPLELEQAGAWLDGYLRVRS